MNKPGNILDLWRGPDHPCDDDVWKWNQIILARQNVDLFRLILIELVYMFTSVALSHKIHWNPISRRPLLLLSPGRMFFIVFIVRQ